MKHLIITLISILAPSQIAESIEELYNMSAYLWSSNLGLEEIIPEARW